MAPVTRPSRRPWTRLSAAALAATLALGGCSVFSPDNGSSELDSFIEALNNEDAGAAAALTSNPEAARASIEKSISGLTSDEQGPDLEIDRGDGDLPDGTVSLGMTWNLAPDRDGNPRTITGTGAAGMTKVGEEWKVEWSPAVLDDRFGEGDSLLLKNELDYSGRVLAADGTPSMEWLPVTNVQIPTSAIGPESQAPEQVAALVGQQFPEITAQSIRDGAQRAIDGAAESGEEEPENYTVVSLREEDIAPIREQLAGTENVILDEDHRLISVGLPSPAMSSVEEPLRERMGERGGWSAGIASSGVIREELASAAPEPIGDITTTLDPAIQSAAQSAVSGSGFASSIVAIRPSTGEVVAVAQNDSASSLGPVALQGHFPPGSTFKVVTTSAALGAGVVGANDTVSCPGVASVDGRTIPNEDEFALGQVSMGTAFARSCNTTQAMLSSGLTDTALRDTAAQLGIGTEMTIPGLDAYTGEVPVAEQGPARVEASIGQGTVTASPFGLALMSASVAAGGNLVLPTFFQGEPATVPNPPAPLDPAVASTIQDYMRQVVTSGTGTGAGGIPDLRGKTGTAETGMGDPHGWFTGYAGDLAFAVLMQEADSSKPAVSMAANFLSQAPY